MEEKGLNPYKVKTLIEIINESLKKSDSYRMCCQLTAAERAELSKRFDIEESFDDIYIFVKKKTDDK
jgi:hypothetical protein